MSGNISKQEIRALCVAITGLMAVSAFAKPPGGKPGGDEPPPDVEFNIVYSEYDTGSLYLSTEDGSVRLQITPSNNGPSSPRDESPTYSPSGDRIAFLRHPDRSLILTDLYLMNADGTGVTFVASLWPPPLDFNAAREDTITWTPTEQEIVYASNRGIYAVELSTSTVRQLAEFDQDVSDTDISWVRGEMAYYLYGDIWRVPIALDENGLLSPLDLTQVVPITTNGIEIREQHPRFSPDGSSVAYQRDSSLAVYNFETGSLEIVVQNSFGSESTWSPDGTRIAFREVLSIGGTKSTTDVLVVDVATGLITNITNTGKEREHQADWRPDPLLLLGE